MYLVSTNEFFFVLTMFHVEIQRSACEHVCSKAENFRALCTGEKGDGKASAGSFSNIAFWAHRTGCFVGIFDHPYGLVTENVGLIFPMIASHFS